MTIITIRAEAAVAALERSRVAEWLNENICPCKRCRCLVTATRVAGQEYTWRVQAA